MFSEMSGCKKQQGMFQNLTIFVLYIKLHQTDMQPTFNIWEFLYRLINIPFGTKIYIHNVSLLNNFQRAFSNIIKHTQ